MIARKATDWIETFMHALGDEIRRRRKGRGWYRHDLRDRLSEDVSLQTLAAYELGTRKLTVVRLVDVAKALDTTPAEIVAAAYQRVFDDPDTSTGWTIDLRGATGLRSADLRPLRNWAKLRLAELPPGRPKTAWLTRPAINALAELCGLEPKAMVKRLPRSDLAE